MKGRDRKADLAKVARAWSKQLTDYNYGPLSEKRPLGSSYVEGDILDILKLPNPEDDPSHEKYADELFRELGKFLQQAITRGTR